MSDNDTDGLIKRIVFQENQVNDMIAEIVSLQNQLDRFRTALEAISREPGYAGGLALKALACRPPPQPEKGKLVLS